MLKSTSEAAASTVGSSSFNPNNLFDNDQIGQQVHDSLAKDDLRHAIITAFQLEENDEYVYHAITSVSLTQVQHAIALGPENGLHGWYIDEHGVSLGNPSRPDIEAYISVFSPSKSSANSLKSLAMNAKKNSLRAEIASNLLDKRNLDARFKVSKRKVHPNPYLDFWAWSCRNLEYGGPTASAVNVKTSHHILPVFMHHFGCVAPSYESLEIIRQVANGKAICDIGSGNGYWTFMLRRMDLTVYAVDNLQSIFRTQWIADTIIEDGPRWLKGRAGASNDVLLLVYPVVGGNFTRKILAAYKGAVVCVAGTQNRNGYTGFGNKIIDEFIAEEMKDFEKTAQIPLPSFAGKDEALFVFERRRPA